MQKSPVGQTKVASSSHSCGGACNCRMLESSDEEYDTQWEEEEEEEEVFQVPS